MVFVDSSEISVTIRNAVRNLQQLGQSVENSEFIDADFTNIDYVADTLIALEKEILKLYNDYETESIDSSRLRYRLKLLPTEIKNEIQAAVIMARESNVTVIQTLQKELDSQLEQVRRYTEQDTQLTDAISALQAEKTALQSTYDTTIHEVNQRLSEKAYLQINLNETRDTVRETNEQTFDLEEDMTSLKERLMQERNDARQEKGRLEDDCAATVKRYEEQERANQLLKKDVDLATHQVSESEMQLRSMYRERERFENEALEIKRKLDEQNELFEMEQREQDTIIRERLEYTEQCGISLLDYQTKKAALEQRAKAAQDRSNEETENLKILKQKHDEILKTIEEQLSASKLLEGTITETGKELEEIKLEIARKLEKTAQLNLENAETSKELENMREAHQMMIDSLKLQISTLERELELIREQRVNKQKEREILLRNIEQAKLTSRNNDIRHNRFVTQTTARVNELTERKSILDRNAREDQLQLNQLEEKLSSLKLEYRTTKTQLEQEIDRLEKTTAELLRHIELNRKKVDEETPEFETLTKRHAETTQTYEAAKELMIETKRKKQDLLDRIANIQRTIREKNSTRDLKISTVKERQREIQRQIQNANENLMELENEIYDKGCRLETLQFENEHFEKTIDYLRYQIQLFKQFDEQSNDDMKHLDENNGRLIEKLAIGWQDDRILENQAAERDQLYIKDLGVLLENTEKRKNKVGTVVYQLIGELQQLKYYLEGMSSPSPPPEPTPPTSPKSPARKHQRAKSQERVHSTVPQSSSPVMPIRERPQSATNAENAVPVPLQMTKDVRERVSHFVEDNFHIRPPSIMKKTPFRSPRARFLSEKSGSASLPPTPDDGTDHKKTPTTLRVAFA